MGRLDYKKSYYPWTAGVNKRTGDTMDECLRIEMFSGTTNNFCQEKNECERAAVSDGCLMDVGDN